MKRPLSKVLFIVPYPVRHAPSQRFRVELYEPYLQEAGIAYDIAPFMDAKTWTLLYRQGSAIQKALGIAKGFLRRIKTVLFDIHKYDCVFIHREAAPLGPPIFEWIIAKLWRKKVIYDFDDAIWIPNTSRENSLAGILKAFWKVKHICKWSHSVIGGNQFLCDYAAHFNKNTVLIPTCVDMTRMHNKTKVHHDGTVVIGWTGSHSTLPYLADVMDVLQYTETKFSTKFIVIANRKPDLPLHNWEYIEWNEHTEIEDLLRIDIGIMPLTDDKWSEGKCGFKLIQYLALGIPAVASPVGVNKTIIEQGVNGYTCKTKHEWKDALEKLISDANFRKAAGEEGHKKMLAQFSIEAHKKHLIQLLLA